MLSKTFKGEWIQLREKEEELYICGVFPSSHESCKYIKNCYYINILAAIQVPYIVFGNEGLEQCRCWTSFRYCTFLSPRHKNMDLRMAYQLRPDVFLQQYLVFNSERYPGWSMKGCANSWVSEGKCHWVLAGWSLGVSGQMVFNNLGFNSCGEFMPSFLWTLDSFSIFSILWHKNDKSLTCPFLVCLLPV